MLSLLQLLSSMWFTGGEGDCIRKIDRGQRMVSKAS